MERRAGARLALQEPHLLRLPAAHSHYWVVQDSCQVRCEGLSPVTVCCSMRVHHSGAGF